MKKLLFLSLSALLAAPVAAQTLPDTSTPVPLPPPMPQPSTVPPPMQPTPVVASPPEAPENRVAATQGATYVPLDADTYRLIDRYAIKYGPDSLNDPHTSVRPYSRAAVARLGERMQAGGGASAAPLSRADMFNAEYLLRDNWANSAQGAALNASNKPLLKYFYRNQTDLYHVQTKDFTLRVNPVLLFQGGRDNDISGLRYVNTRGVQVEGTVDQRLGFYTFLTDNQQAVPFYVQNRIVRDTIVPHEGYWKFFKTIGGSQYDFFSARGYVTYAALKHVNVQLGHDRNFIGNGYRSLILSDYSTPYFFLKLNTRVWKLNYQNLYTELTARRVPGLDTKYPKKYMALHHLSLDVTPTLNIGVFESEVFGGSKRGFEMQYLNPIIFYRAIEQQLGSADNAILGLDFKWNIKRTAQLYGQLVLDEFKLSEMRAGNGWWGNKQAFQLGAKYIDVAGIRNLDLQLEYNYIRPFTYQHSNAYTSYTHFNQPLAHPLGANLTELVGVLSYQPLPRLTLVGKAFYTVQGLDFYDTRGNFQNYGSNPLVSYDILPLNPDGQPRFYGYKTGDGLKSRLLHADFTATYQPRLNLFVDAKLIARQQSIEGGVPSYYGATSGNEIFASLALRWNIAQRLHGF
ncbi:hypothetical protein GCM10023185_35340 [Hymenobacter saemangeumensis]|uniref:Capsule assembly Wzi family protein n=1 Tax=Hymenobacter saemangeumensis TaxID=1084522 RepID=A0ABP8IQZ1_9BACT